MNANCSASLFKIIHANFLILRNPTHFKTALYNLLKFNTSAIFWNRLSAGLQTLVLLVLVDTLVLLLFSVMLFPKLLSYAFFKHFTKMYIPNETIIKPFRLFALRYTL